MVEEPVGEGCVLETVIMLLLLVAMVIGFAVIAHFVANEWGHFYFGSDGSCMGWKNMLVVYWWVVLVLDSVWGMWVWE